MTRRPGPLALGAILVMAAVVAGWSAVAHRHRPTRRTAVAVPVVMAAAASDVVAVAVKDRKAVVEMDRIAGGWQPRPGTTSASAALLGEREGDLFPLRAYRVLKSEETRPDYGLSDPELILQVDEGGGRTETVEVGAATFNAEGFYAHRRGDPHVYLLTRRAVDGLRSALRGEPVTTARPDPERERLATAEQLSDSEMTTNPWLDQILGEAGP
jgi:hypothetical protein